jgi:hypothetical protein
MAVLSHITAFQHIGVTVDDLDRATACFVLMAYVRGPEGIVVALTERIG